MMPVEIIPGRCAAVVPPEFAAGRGFDAVLLSMAALPTASIAQLLEHVRTVAAARVSRTPHDKLEPGAYFRKHIPEGLFRAVNLAFAHRG